MWKIHIPLACMICIICILSLTGCSGKGEEGTAHFAGSAAEEAGRMEDGSSQTAETLEYSTVKETSAAKETAERQEQAAELEGQMLDLPSAGEKESSTLEELVAQAILDSEGCRYAEGECRGEGHEILGTEEIVEDGMTRLKVYTLAMYGEYQFQDGNLVKESGSGVIPTVMTFSVDNDKNSNDYENYTLKDYQVPMDGNTYVDSVHELFLARFWAACLSDSENVREELKKQERAYAEAYLREIGRTAQVGDYGDFAHILLTDEGVSVEVSNKMAENKDLWAYPFWIGNVERLEDGIRYRYSMELDKEKGKILYQKTDVGHGEKVVETFSFDAETGEPLSSGDQKK